MVFPLLPSAISLSDGEWPASNYTLKTNIKVKVLDFVQLGGGQATGPGSRIPQPATAPSHRYPDVVTVEFAEDDEEVFGNASRLVCEWRRLWQDHPDQGRGPR